MFRENVFKTDFRDFSTGLTLSHDDLHQNLSDRAENVFRDTCRYIMEMNLDFTKKIPLIF